MDKRRKNRIASPRGMILHLILLLFTPHLFASSRTSTDVVYMTNGDKITCEIRSLSQGQLTVKQKYANSTVTLDWLRVDHIESVQRFVVIDTQGRIFSGVLTETAIDHMVWIDGPPKNQVPHDEVVSIQQTGKTLFKSLQGDIDLGISFAQSNAQKNLTVQGDLNYQGTKSIGSLSVSSQFTTQKETSNTDETTLKSGLFRELRKSKWYGGGIANFLSSSEQQINLQTTVGGAFAVRPVFTNKTNLALFGGLTYTNQSDASDTTSTASANSIDAAAAVQYSTFRFDSTSFDTTIWVYPGLTTPGRVRMTLNQDIYFKFYRDFYVRASFYDNFDNRPVVGAPSNNLGFTSTVGWSFR
jgi:hypothetical protein